jgi:hypothetical protein
MHIFTYTITTAFAVTTANALSLDVTSTGTSSFVILRICIELIIATDSIKTAAKAVTKGLLAPYNGTQAGGIPGIYSAPYYWWSGGAVWDSLVDYWYLTGDSTYNDIVKQSLEFQVGPNNDYMPSNQTKSEVRTKVSHVSANPTNNLAGQ